MRLKYSIVYFIILLIINYVLSSIYRPFIYSNNINDYGLADVGNNIIFIPGVYFMILLFRKKPFLGFYKDIYFHVLFLVIVEISSKYINGIGTFDYKDIVGLLLGGLLTILIVKLHLKKPPTTDLI